MSILLYFGDVYQPIDNHQTYIEYRVADGSLNEFNYIPVYAGLLNPLPSGDDSGAFPEDEDVPEFTPPAPVLPPRFFLPAVPESTVPEPGYGLMVALALSAIAIRCKRATLRARRRSDS